MAGNCERRYRQLCAILARYSGQGKVAVAYSGGVDSSLLAHAALRTLGSENVLVLHGLSQLLARYDLALVQDDLDRDSILKQACCQVLVDPLLWPEFVENTEQRCYHCKRRLYSLFLEEIKAAGGSVVMDGTNCDDRMSVRPGLRAIEELGVIVPLEEAGLGKQEIRSLSKHLGLPAHDRLSNSCLATRIPTLTPISPGLLRSVEKGEELLRGMGFYGCRVRPQKKGVVLHLCDQDFNRLADRGVCADIIECFRVIGFQGSHFELNGESGGRIELDIL